MDNVLRLLILLLPAFLTLLVTGQREGCPMEIDFPSTVVIKGRTVHCSPTPPQYDCEWYDLTHYACHHLRIDEHHLTHSKNATLESQYADLCLEMLMEIGEGLGRTATGHVSYNTTAGTIHYSTENGWIILSEIGMPPTNESYFRIACQTSKVARDRGSH